MLSIVIYRTWNDQEALLVKGILEQYGIPVSLETDISHALYPFTVDGLGETRVAVPSAAGAEARSILDLYRRRERPADA